MNKKPDLRLVQRNIKPLFPGNKKQVTNLINRLYEVCIDYCEQEYQMGRIVTCAEMVGMIDMLKDKIKR